MNAPFFKCLAIRISDYPFNWSRMAVVIALLVALAITACTGSASSGDAAATGSNTPSTSAIPTAGARTVSIEDKATTVTVEPTADASLLDQAKTLPSEAGSITKAVNVPAKVVPNTEAKTVLIDSEPDTWLDSNAIVAAQEEVMESIYDRVLPSVVHIRVAQKVVQQEKAPSFPDFPGFPFGFDRSAPLPRTPQEFYQRGEGSGFVWDNQGHIVTNNHVVEDADTVTVVFADG
ncbi:MAG: hypothetical protein ACE5JL_00535, partial [Dehalococcoidia bacterium]